MSIFSYLRRAIALASIAVAVQAAPATEPTNGERFPTTQITWFGERPSWSPDGQRIAFMSKSFGDAFELDLQTQHITLLTHFPNPGFLRVQYLPNGDYFLIGAREFQDIESTRDDDQEMWVLKQGEQEPVALNRKIWEGVAISRKTNKIAWANSWENYPDMFTENETAIFVGDIDYTDGQPTLTNVKEVIRALKPDCTLEPQDFFDNDSQLTYTCYNKTELPQVGSVRGINLVTGEVTVYRFVSGEYNEVEGLFPDEKYTCVESAKDQLVPSNASQHIDIWRLRLEPYSNDFVRLTYFGETPGRKSSNPVVSPDGLTVAFQEGRTGDAPGVGYGMHLVHLG